MIVPRTPCLARTPCSSCCTLVRAMDTYIGRWRHHIHPVQPRIPLFCGCCPCKTRTVIFLDLSCNEPQPPGDRRLSTFSLSWLCTIRWCWHRKVRPGLRIGFTVQRSMLNDVIPTRTNNRQIVTDGWGVCATHSRPAALPRCLPHSFRRCDWRLAIPCLLCANAWFTSFPIPVVWTQAASTSLGSRSVNNQRCRDDRDGQ